MNAVQELATKWDSATRVVLRHPVRFWRFHLAGDYDARTVKTMRASLTRIGIVGERRWMDAATGDAAAATVVFATFR
jgi:hypothetical protein